ncbi:MAG: SsrA-binding protein SmpB [Chloroflexi bacterium]|nr:SsrA-binding protein SmpB [Chloroflexota bacterium]
MSPPRKPTTTKAPAPAIKVIAENRKARFDYHLEEKMEAGLALTGTEIKALREGRVNLREGYARIVGREAWLLNVHIAPYSQGGRYNHDPLRPRKLLLHRKEIGLLAGRAAERGYTLVPLRLYLKRGRAKVEIALAQGKKQYDKREALAKKEAGREMARALRQRG